MPINNSGSGIGSGNPYFGSGFTNFENFLQPENIDWGRSQNQMVPASNDWSQQTPFDNWMINRGGGGPKPAVPDLELNDVSQVPMQTLPSTSPTSAPTTTTPTKIPFPGATPAPPVQQPAPSDTNPTGGGVWTAHVPDPRVPGGYDKTYNYNDPRLPSGQRGQYPTPTASTASAFPTLDKKLQQGVW